MNNVLISDPFLFPPSGEDIFRGPTLPKNILEYSTKQFAQEWEVASHQAETVVKSYNLWPACLSSPTITSSSEEYLHNLEEMDLQGSWLESTAMGINEDDLLNLNQIAREPMDLVAEPDDPLFDPSTLEDLCTLDFEDIFGKNSNVKSTEVAEPENMEDDSWKQQFPQLAGPVIDQLQVQHALEAQFSSHDTMDGVSPNDISPLNNLIEEATTSTSRSRRKTTQVSRIASDSPLSYSTEESTNIALPEVDVKPNIRALSNLNGTSSRKRIQSNSREHPSSSSNSKRKRKYEEDDDTDVAVKNAKAAKLNRDKKKKEMAELKATVEKLTSEKEELQQELSTVRKDLSSIVEQERSAKLHWETKYKEEKEKNLINNGLTGQLTNAKRVLELIVPTLSQSYGQMSVEISEAFENIPVRTDDQGVILLPAVPTLGQSYDTGVEQVSSYTTFHVSTDEKMIKVDYSPHLP